MKQINAFLYNNTYYALKQGESISALKQSMIAVVTRLNEKNCKAPDFVEEETEEVEVIFDQTEPIFPLTARLFTRSEYDTLLRQRVESKCEGCVRFGGDSDDLTGHYEEMSVDGVCYLRSLDTEAPFGWYMETFVEELTEKLPELKTYVDTDDQDAIVETLGGLMAKFFLPIETYGGINYDGKYFLCFTGEAYFSKGFHIVLRTLAELCNEEDSEFHKSGWIFYPYAPKDIYRPKLRPDFYKRPPEIYYYENEDSGDSEITVIQKDVESWSKKTERSRNDAIYKYLCSTIGEDVLLAGTTALRISDTYDERDEKITAEALGDRIRKEIKAEFGEVAFPSPYYIKPQSDDIKMLPYKDQIESWTTICPELSPDGQSFDPDMPDEADEKMRKLNFGHEVFSALNIGYVYVYLPNEPNLGYNKKRIFEKYFGKVLKSESFMADETSVCKKVGVVETKHGICIDFIIYDIKAFFEGISRTTPVLENMQAKIVVVNDGDATIYEPKFNLSPVGSEYFS